MKSYAKCKVCKQDLSAILSPFESFKKQLKRLFNGYCSQICEGSSNIKSKKLVNRAGLARLFEEHGMDMNDRSTFHEVYGDNGKTYKISDILEFIFGVVK